MHVQHHQRRSSLAQPARRRQRTRMEMRSRHISHGMIVSMFLSAVALQAGIIFIHFWLRHEVYRHNVTAASEHDSAASTAAPTIPQIDEQLSLNQHADGERTDASNTNKATTIGASNSESYSDANQSAAHAIDDEIDVLQQRMHDILGRPANHGDDGDANDYERKELRSIFSNPSPTLNDSDTLLSVYEDLMEYYGSKPIIHGKEQHCAAFQQNVPLLFRRIAVAGMFNSGTNLVYNLLADNCKFSDVPTSKSHLNSMTTNTTNSTWIPIEWMVPWGKHVLANRWQTRKTVDSGRLNPKFTLAVVTIRDPYEWMASMCQHPYVVKWQHELSLTRQQRSKRNRMRKQQAHLFRADADSQDTSIPREDLVLPPCPMLTYNPMNGSKVPVHIFEDGDGEDQVLDPNLPLPTPTATFDSILEYWNEWYSQYWNLFIHGDPPALMVRLEDLVLHPQETIHEICTCAGGEYTAPADAQFQFPIESVKPAKGHGSQRTGAWKAWQNLIRRMYQPQNGLADVDSKVAKRTIDDMLMDAFQYHHPRRTKQH